MEYLEEMIAKYKKTDLYSDDENKIFNEFKKYFEEQFLKIYSNGNFNTASALASRNPLDVQQSGSRKKGTCIKGHSDLDMFFSITDYNGRTCEQYYNDLFDITKKTKYNGKLIASRKQRFSIGFEINGIDIDIVPALKITNFGSSDDHFLFNSKKHSLQKTNIKKQIDYVKNSGYQGVIILLKL
jgi:tRNA nucleotidyltransferase (CCA-adding enzyme)